MYSWFINNIYRNFFSFLYNDNLASIFVLWLCLSVCLTYIVLIDSAGVWNVFPPIKNLNVLLTLFLYVEGHADILP